MASSPPTDTAPHYTHHQCPRSDRLRLARLSHSLVRSSGGRLYVSIQRPLWDPARSSGSLKVESILTEKSKERSACPRAPRSACPRARAQLPPLWLLSLHTSPWLQMVTEVDPKLVVQRHVGRDAPDILCCAPRLTCGTRNRSMQVHVRLVCYGFRASGHCKHHATGLDLPRTLCVATLYTNMST